MLLLGFWAPLSAQATYAYRYANGYIGNSIRQADDKGYLITGGTDSYDAISYQVWEGGDWRRNADLFLMKTDEFSKVLWQRHWGTDTTRESGNWLEILPDSGLIIVGSTTYEQNVSMATPMDSSDVLLIRTDKDGNELWNRRFDSGGDEVGYSVNKTHDGGFLVSAFCDLNPFSLIGFTRAWLIKTDAGGNLLWEAKYQFAIRDFDTGRPFIYVAKETSDSGFVIVGTTFSTHQADTYVMRLDSTGAVLWARSYDNMLPNLSGGYDILELSDGNFIIAGFMDLDRPGTKVNYPLTMKIDPSGNLIKARIWDYFSFRDRAGFSSVKETPDGNLIFCGKAGYGATGLELAILKTDLNLNRIWGKHFEDFMTGAPMGGGKDIIPAADGGYALTGIYQFDGVCLLKMDDLGNIDCHIPNGLLEAVPPVNTIVWNPDSLQGVLVSTWNYDILGLIEDTIRSCGVINPLAVSNLQFSGKYLEAGFNQLNWQLPEHEETPKVIQLFRSTTGQDFEAIASLNQLPQGMRKAFVWKDPDLDDSDRFFYKMTIQYPEKTVNSQVIEIIVPQKPGVRKLQIARLSPDRIGLSLPGAEHDRWQLVDQQGRVLLQGSAISGDDTAQTEIDLSQLPAGIYFIRVFCLNGAISTGKVCKF